MHWDCGLGLLGSGDINREGLSLSSMTWDLRFLESGEKMIVEMQCAQGHFRCALG